MSEVRKDESDLIKGAAIKKKQKCFNDLSNSRLCKRELQFRGVIQTNRLIGRSEETKKKMQASRQYSSLQFFFVYARSYQNMTFDFGLSTIAIFRSLFSEKKFLFYFCTVKCVLCSFYPCNNHISFDSMYVNSSPLIVKNTNFKKKDFSV